MIALPVTSVVAAALAIMMLPLTLQVSLRRAQLRRVYGAGDDETLRRRVRAFGNFVEYAPFCLLLLALMEAQGAPDPWLSIVGGLLFAGRAIHAVGMLYVSSPAPRGVGMLMTYAAFLIPAAWMLLRLSG